MLKTAGSHAVYPTSAFKKTKSSSKWQYWCTVHQDLDQTLGLHQVSLRILQTLLAPKTHTAR